VVTRLTVIVSYVCDESGTNSPDTVVTRLTVIVSYVYDESGTNSPALLSFKKHHS